LQFFEELKRRNVFRVGIAYVVTAWLVIQVVETIFPAFGFGDAAVRTAVIVLAIGFPVVLIGGGSPFILAGGRGTRLQPLTNHRSKPSVPYGGKYRIIDFTLANCLHSGLRRLLVLTQYKSHSLNKHLRDGWSIFNPELGEYITAVPAQMRHGNRWYTGTADAIYQNLYLLERSEAEYVLILSGDHIYRMDYAAMLDAHQKNKADATVACMNISLDAAKRYGVMATDGTGRITDSRLSYDIIRRQLL